MRSAIPVLLALAGCGGARIEPIGPTAAESTTAPPAVPKPAAPPVPEVEAVRAAPEVAAALGGYSLVFHAKVSDAVEQLVVAPWGDVIAIGLTEARVLARDSGRELSSVAVCAKPPGNLGPPDAAAFVDEHRLLVACGYEVQEVTFPAGRVRTVLTFPDGLRAAGFGGGRLAVAVDGDRKGTRTRVTVHAGQGFKVVDRFDTPGRIAGIAVSPDGRRVAVGTEEGSIHLRDVAAKATRALPPDESPGARNALRFSPDGARLATDVVGAACGEIDLASGRALGGLKAHNSMRTMRYLADGSMVVVTAVGTFLGRSGGEPTRATPADLDEALDVSADGRFVCAAGGSGDVACFSDRPVAPSTFVAPAPQESAAPVAVSVKGSIASHAGDALTVTLAEASDVAPGEEGTLASAPGGDVSPVVLARVRVKAVAGRRVSLVILEEKIEVRAGGSRKVDVFEPNLAVSLTVRRSPRAAPAGPPPARRRRE